jgi:hypothetical protein
MTKVTIFTFKSRRGFERKTGKGGIHRHLRQESLKVFLDIGLRVMKTLLAVLLIVTGFVTVPATTLKLRRSETGILRNDFKVLDGFYPVSHRSDMDGNAFVRVWLESNFNANAT